MIRASALSFAPTSLSCRSLSAVTGLSRATMRAMSSVRISPSVRIDRSAGVRNRFRAASASSMMRRATA